MLQYAIMFHFGPRTTVTCILVFLSVTVALFPQEIVTAEKYLERVAGVYGGFRDYEAKITILSGTQTMYGTVSHLAPSFLRIDFTTPSGQVLVFNGNTLTVYLPEYAAILTQTLTQADMRSGAALASAGGLSLLRRNYAPAYSSSPEPEPLEEGSHERVVKLRLTRRYGSEAYREIVLSIVPDTLMIRRIDGLTTADSRVRFDFRDTKTNQGIPEARFLYDSPASANVYNNFLLRERN
jgi:outer membrane lipoprotein-sorting protein